jgi:hypothetical protein
VPVVIEHLPVPFLAAGAAGELALAVLATPGPPQLTILSNLEHNDK